jgi:tetrathionate reductase subunit A
MKESTAPRLTRRRFLKTTALLGGSAFLLSRLGWPSELFARTRLAEYELTKPENILYTVCQQCNTQCGLKVKLYDGLAAKLEGNPYSPWNLQPNISYRTSPLDVATLDGRLCPKGQAGIQTVYDPYRVVKVLKRAGKRGENKWVTISFDQAVDEIVNGGDLFGEGHVPGLKEIWALRDPKLAKEMADDVKAIWAKKTPEEKKAAVEAFKTKYAEHLDKLIDPDHPDLGPKNNQLVFMWGRLKGGRSELIKRFTVESFGSVNAHGHTTVCQGSLYFASKAMSEQYQKGSWTGGKKFYWQADQNNSEFIIFVGASPFEGNYGPTNRAPGLTRGLVSGRLKFAVVDPRFSKTASKAWKWIPIKPGTEAALALAMIRWIIENKRYDAKYLSNANKAAAVADKEPTWTNACWLVKIVDGRPEKFLRAKELGLTDEDRFVVLQDGKPVAFDPYDTANPVKGDLFVDTTIQGIRVKSGLQILWESASSKTLEEWSAICDVPVRDIIELAREFTSHGKKAAVDVHRGVSQHTNGFYNVFAWFALNLLIGNYDWKGGMSQASTFDHTGGKEGQPFNFAKLNPGKTTAFGISIIRHEIKYEQTTLFERYPAKRPWYPLSSDIYQEIIPSAGDGYPYPIKALFIYMGSPVYALPAGHTNIEILADPKKIPLIVASDITIGETSMYADYIFPDLSYLERWEFAGSHPSITQKVQPIRQPVIAPLTETVKVFGQEMPLSLEAMLLGIAEKLGLPGFGQGGFGEGQDFTHPDQFYLRMVANVAAGDRPGNEVPDADDAELELFLRARRHLPKTVFDPERWRQIVGEKWWRKVVYVLNRGGRFDNWEQGYDGDYIKNRYGTLINLYQEKTALTINSMTGKPLAGYPIYLPLADSVGRPIEDEKQGFELHLITHREIVATKSRTISNYWLLAVMPENAIVMHPRDAQRLGLSEGDRVKIISASNPEGVWDLANGTKVPMIGTVHLTEGIRPGVISFALGYGHWAYGATDLVIDGETIKGDERRRATGLGGGAGVHANAAMRVDPYLKNTCLVDVYGGSAVFYDTRVKVVKV